MRGFKFDGFTRPRGEDLDALCQLLGIGIEPEQPEFNDDDEIPAEVKAFGLMLGAALGADSVTVLKIPKQRQRPQRRGHPGRHHPSFAG
jgi:hypothetical protein